ncbi:hypothetical protein [Roseateles sp.]|uniref:hypothetical protein n=1 Tax=Roseateles sp. TaxID=1971397 RepID=UPI00326499BF
MGSIIYGHLNDSLLLDPSAVATEYDGVSDNELQDALAQYRAFCVTNMDELLDEVSPQQGRLRLYVGDVSDEKLLKQGAFYLDTVIISDPMFALTTPEHELTSAWSKAFDMRAPERLNRKDVARATKTLLYCRPLVTEGYVRFFPTSLADEAPEDLPMYAPEDGFEGLLPPHLLSMCKDAARVRSVVSSPEGLVVMSDLDLGRRIHIDFGGVANGRGFGFNLIQQEVVSWDPKTRLAQVAMKLPKEPPTQEMFDAWVAQSVNSSARQHFDSLCRDVRWSTRFGAQLMTRSTFAASVLESSEQVTNATIPTATASGWLNLDLNVFDDLPMSKLMEARSDEEAFRRFRRHLEKQFRELRLETDPEKRRQKTENAMHELLDIQLTEVDSAIQRLKRKGLLSGLGVVASLGAALATSPATLIATLGAAYAGLRTIEEYRIAAKESPAYFLWRTLGPKRP